MTPELESQIRKEFELGLNVTPHSLSQKYEIPIEEIYEILKRKD